MSIQAVAWALEQDFTYTTAKGHVRSCHAAKLVLLSLANHADHTNGHCWPSAETIAREASCAVASVYRMVAALARNGFIEVKKVRGPDGKQRSNNYWICFDRKPAAWQFFAGDEDEPGDPEPSDTKSPGENVSETDSESPGPGDVRVTRHKKPEPSVIEPSDSEILDSTRATTLVAAAPSPPKPVKPPPAQPSRFDSQARQREQQRLKAADEARKPKRYPVIRGTPAWSAHVAEGHPDSLYTQITMPDGRRDFGWYFPTLWPPRKSDHLDEEATGPPLPLESSQTRKTG